LGRLDYLRMCYTSIEFQGLRTKQYIIFMLIVVMIFFPSADDFSILLQLCMQAAASVAYWLQSTVIYVDTCNGFSATRVANILDNFLGSHEARMMVSGTFQMHPRETTLFGGSY
jgi:hypothetical protein